MAVDVVHTKTTFAAAGTKVFRVDENQPFEWQLRLINSSADPAAVIVKLRDGDGDYVQVDGSPFTVPPLDGIGVTLYHSAKDCALTVSSPGVVNLKAKLVAWVDPDRPATLTYNTKGVTVL